MKRDKFIIHLLILLFISLEFYSCRFSNPIFKGQLQIDTIHQLDTIEINKTYNYLRYSRYGLHGQFMIIETYNKNNELISFEIDKRSTNKKIRDGRQKHVRKYNIYKNGKLTETYKHIAKRRGLGGKLVCDKTLYYDDNGKLTKRINSKKDKKKKNKKENGG